MQVIYPCCCGLDVHKQTVVSCVRQTRSDGGIDQQVRTFATTTAGLLELGDWLLEQGVTIAAMESTGVYWKPVSGSATPPASVRRAGRPPAAPWPGP